MGTCARRAMLVIWSLLLAVPLLTLACEVGLAKSMAVVTLRDGAVVTGDDILLGQIAEIEGPDEMVRILTEVVVGRAPLPGKERAISIGHVEVRLRQVGISTRDVEVRTDNGERRITVRAEAGVPATVVQGETGSDGVEVWCLVTGVERHAPVTLELLERVTVPRHKFVGTPVQSGEQLVGMRAKRTLRAGEVLTAEVLEPIPLVSKGERVSLQATYGGVQVVTTGIAESDGSLGDVIIVINAASGKKVHACVIGEGIVEALGTQ